MPRKIKQRSKIVDVKERHETQLMGLEGVVGVGIGGKERKPNLVVYVMKMSPKLVQTIPKEIEGFEVHIEESGEFVAFNP